MASPYRSKYWREAFCVAAAVILPACSEAVTMNRESDHGGVVTYLYKVDRGGPMGSKYRREALDLIKAKCPAGSRIIREGETRGYSSAGMGMVEGTEDEIRGTRWGIQFECKDGDRTVTDQGARHAGGQPK
ncbi:MAG: hypothetical protein AB7G68_19830 [Nitrospiraceae bacterium]